MTGKVIDASALAAVAFQEQEQFTVLAQLHGNELHAPFLLRLEVANLCLKKIRRQPADRMLLLSQHLASQSMAIKEHTIASPAVLDLAERFNLSGYDASYLWLARELGAELVTLDARLEHAAKTLQSNP